MGKLYHKPEFNITSFSSENVAAAETSLLVQTNAYGMQDYTTLQKVSHEIQAGAPTVREILKFHVGN